MYISCNLLKEEITLQTIWSRFKDFCKPQSNAVHARFDLLTAFWQGNRSMDDWYNGVLVHISLCEYPKDIFWFFMTDNEFIAKPLMKATLTLHSTHLQKCDRCPKSLNPAKQLPNTSNSPHPVCKALLKSMFYDIIALAYHLRRKR